MTVSEVKPPSPKPVMTSEIEKSWILHSNIVNMMSSSYI